MMHSSEDWKNLSIRVMSYNIRFDNPKDGENQWHLRKERLTGLIRYHQPDLLGTQEALPNQVRDLEAALTDYAWYGAGREDGREAGEFLAIFYRKKRFGVLNKGTFWLSPTPEVPSMGWDANVIRVCSWVKLNDKPHNRTFFHFNTHFDHLGELARIESAKLLLEKIPAIAGNSPAVVTGDFNDPPKSRFYNEIVPGTLLRDARQITQTPPDGPEGTWATFDVHEGIGNQIILSLSLRQSAYYAMPT